MELLWKVFWDRSRVGRVLSTVSILLCLVSIRGNGESISAVCERFPDIHCPNGECTRYEIISCENGQCNNSTGLCECLPCWSGPNCDILENEFLPTFEETSLIVVVDTYDVENVIANVVAKDDDDEKCRGLDDECPCARILYAIESGNEDSIFLINPRTGAIQLSGKNSHDRANFPAPGTQQKLVISARNPVHKSRRQQRQKVSASKDDVIDTVIVMIEFDDEPVEDGFDRYTLSKNEEYEIDIASSKRWSNLVNDDDDEQVVHSRRKRSNSGTPSEVTYFLEKIGSSVDVTDVYIGEIVDLQLTLWMPSGTTSDVDVELLSQSENGAVFILFDESIAFVGGNFPSFDANSITTTYHASADDGRYDQIVMKLGDIANNAADTTDDVPNQIEIQFKAILTVNNATQYGESYDISAAVTYGSNDDIWAGTYPFTPQDDRADWAVASPIISISGPTGQNMSVESASRFFIDVTLRNYASEDIVIDIIADNFTDDAVMTICDYEFSGKGSNYGCMSDESYSLSTTEVNGTVWTVLATLDLGSWVNQGLRYGVDDASSSTLNTEAVVRLTDSPEIVDFSTYWLGVAVAIGGEYVYSNQYGIHAQPLSDADMTTEPTIEFYPIDGNQLVFGGCVGFVVTIDLQESVTSRLIVDLSLPVTSGGDAQMRFCSAEVVSAGYNIPCAKTLQPTYLSYDGENQDYVRFDFGRISNVGRRSSAGDNLLKVHMSAQLLFDSPSVSNGTELTVTSGVRYEMAGRDLVWMNQYPFIAVDQRLNDYSSSSKHPSFTLTNRAPDVLLYTKSAVSFEIEIEIPAETTHTDLTLTIKTPKDDRDLVKPFLSICRVEVLSVSERFPCFDANRTIFTHESTSNRSTVIDKTTVELGVISNAFLTEMMTADPNTPATITLGVFLHWEDHEYHEQGAVLPVTVIGEWGHSGRWSDTIDYTTELDTDPALTSADEDPQFDIFLQSGRSRVLKAGGTAVYTLVMFTPVDTVATYELDVVVPNDTLSICRAMLRHSGENVPCFDDSDHKTSYLSYEEDGHVDRAYLDLGPIRNTGVSPTTRQADNRIVGQIVVKMEPETLPPDNLTLPDPQGFDVAIQVGESHSWSFADTLHVDTNETSTTLDILPEVTFKKMNPSENRVTIGGIAEFHLDIYIPPETIAAYEVEFQSDIDEPYKTTVCEARLISSAWNIPCVNGSFLQTEYNSSTDNQHIDMAYIDAGVMTNMRLMSEGLPVKYDKNQVKVQLLTRLELNDTIVEGEEFWLGAAVRIDGANEFILMSGFNATDLPIFEETNVEPTFHVKPPRGNLSMFVGSKERYYLNISTTDMTTNMAINLSLPTAGDEAFLTITDITLESVGRNYGCFQLWEEEFIPTTVSTKGSSQNDTALIDFGVITNHGTSNRYQYSGPELGDNDIIVSFEIQLADHYQLVNQTLLDFSITFLYSLDREVEFIETVEAIMMPGDLPIIDMNMTVEEFDIRDVNQGDVVSASLSLEHNEASSAHGHAVMINLMIPHYIGVDPVIEIEGPPLCTETTDEGIKFHFAEMFFTDIFTMWFNFTIDADLFMPIELDVINTTVPLEVIFYKNGGLDNDGYVILGDVFSSELVLLDLTFTIEECSDNLDYAMRDCQFSASSTLNESLAPHQARLNSASGWAPGVRNTPPYTGNDYLQVKFASLMRFTGIKMQVGPNDTHSVETFKISYSEEGLVWYDYEEDGEEVTFTNDFSTFIPEVNVTEDPWVMHYFLAPFNARYFRIRPQTHKAETDYPILRFEAYGCLRELSTSGVDICKADKTTDLGYFERGFLVEPHSATVYVCILEYIDGPTRCSYTKDNGTTWESIDNNVAAILGSHNETGELYGVSQNQDAIVISTDLGDSFYSTNADFYFDLLDEPGRVVEAMRVPWDELADEPDDDYWEYSMQTDLKLAVNQTAGYFMEWAGANTGLFSREVFFDGFNLTMSSWMLVGEWGYP